MGRKHTIHLIVGARPNFVKAAPLLSKFADLLPEVNVKLVHTGQHYDYKMSQVFFDQFRIPKPDYHLGIGSGTHGYQTGRALEALEKLFLEKKPDMVIVLGDVNPTLAAALAAVKIHVPIAHIEAGLRSFDMRMPEEVNRILTDHISDLLFVTENAGIDNLRKEGIDQDKMYLVGNIMIDALAGIMPQVETSTILRELDLDPGSYSVITLHRPGNVDVGEQLLVALDIIREASSAGEVVFPAHPRTLESISRLDMKSAFDSVSDLHIIEPRGYVDFMKLISRARFVMTDSGGIQTEASYLGVPCITLRDETEHLITLSKGTNILAGMDLLRFQKALCFATSFDHSDYSVPESLDGKASVRIVTVIQEFMKILQ